MKTSLVLLFLILVSGATAQTPDNFSILFYNVENLFDCKDDSLTSDEEFTPKGDRHWTHKKFQKKVLNISKSILGSAGWDVPGMVALCEVENRYVLERLIKDTPLKTVPYKIIHKESPDFRGIDVALLYHPERFNPIEYRYYPLLDKKGNIKQSREILYVSGIVGEADTLHLFVNHWPSRYSGLMETRRARNDAAKLLRQKIDEIFSRNTGAKIVVVGDFNDQPEDESISNYLLGNGNLYNLSANWGNGQGTLKYQSQWFVFDQIIVSGGLQDAQRGLYTKQEMAAIVKSSYLLQKDEKYGGLKPYRTFIGFKYNGGFSDHLPVILKMKVR